MKFVTTGNPSKFERSTTVVLLSSLKKRKDIEAIYKWEDQAWALIGNTLYPIKKNQGSLFVCRFSETQKLHVTLSQY